ncbi:MAG: AAA family ATPase [Candidatus Cloacimonetes bacterium 4572_55]|nr:MAG: AAA family ATPase [Candidatus Cloacimonetes bacterium 4572_55]
MKFPYGICDFQKIITEDYFYVDRTDQIPRIEEAGKQLLFLRPRRFGKSLLLSMLENYYDLRQADQFETLFGHLAIGKNPTPIHNKYLVMKWDFSMIDPQGDVQNIKMALHSHINDCIDGFSGYYAEFLNRPIKINPTNAISSFQSLLNAVRLSSHRLYLLVDEYDNFANEVMMSRRKNKYQENKDKEDRYESLLYGEGALKTLFKAVKAGAAGWGVDRVFITGVSPVVLSDMTSGYNVAENIYLEPQFNGLCGFYESEIRDAITTIVETCELPSEQVSEVGAMMRAVYNGYAFTLTPKAYVYNPTLALYFLKKFQSQCQYPNEILDSNLAMDRGKLQYISRLPGGSQLILNLIAAEQPFSIPKLSTRFGVEDVLRTTKDVTFMASLLYYFGILTLGGRTAFAETCLNIPNQVVKGLYLERIRETLLPEAEHWTQTAQAAKLLYGNGDMQPLCDFIQSHYLKVYDNRDYRWANELTIKTLFLSLLYNDRLYIMDSEGELERAYADLILIVRPDMRGYTLFDILIEFKYVSLKKVGLSGDQVSKMSLAELKKLPPVKKKWDEALVGLSKYEAVLHKKYDPALKLKSFVVGAVGLDRIIWEEKAS